MNDPLKQLRKKLDRAEIWFLILGGIFFLILLSSCSFRQDIPLGKEGDWGVLYIGYSPPMGRLFRQARTDLPDPPLPVSDGKAVIR